METITPHSEPSTLKKGFSAERSNSMTVLSPQSEQKQPKPRMAQLETLEAKMASIEVSLSSATPRRRKGTSLGGSSTISTRTSPRPESAASRDMRSALQDREAVIQSLRVQLGLNKLPRPVGTPLEEAERPAAEQRLARLKIDSENKKIAIRNLKSALDKLDITDNIDVRIRQAELEYALGREELHLLSLVEEARALQGRLEKSKPEPNTLYSILQSGVSLSLHAIQATVGRWAATPKPECHGLYVEWALDGELLCRGDRILEVNGKILMSRTREDLQRILGNSGKCQLVVIRKRGVNFPQQQLIQTQADNQRLQHRISYLEDQVKELQFTKEPPTVNGTTNGGHVTSISISSPPVTPPEKPQVYQRGNYVTTIIGGKPVDLPITNGKSTHVTKTIIKENGLKEMNGHHHQNGIHHNNNNINHNGNHQNGNHQNGNHQNGNLINGHHHNGSHQNLNNNSISASLISINSDILHLQKRDKERRDYRREERDRIYNNYNKVRHSEGPNHYHGHNHAKSVEHLNYHHSTERKKEHPLQLRRTADLRSVKSLDFDSDNGIRETDYTSEPVAPRLRPTPPKKPLRLSLQRAQSLQTVEAGLLELEKKRALKRTYKGDKTIMENMQYIENSIPLQTASLGRNKHI